jgi:hypothetical protein
MCHICKNMQKAVQNTYTRLLTIIGISGPLPSDGKNVPEGRFSRIQLKSLITNLLLSLSLPALLRWEREIPRMRAIPMAQWCTAKEDTGTTRTVNIEDRSCTVSIVRP